MTPRCCARCSRWTRWSRRRTRASRSRRRCVISTDARARPGAARPGARPSSSPTAPTSPSASATRSSSSSTRPTARCRARPRSPRRSRACSSRSLEAFRSEIAEVILFGSDGTPLRTTLGPGDQRVTMQPGRPRAARGVRRARRRRQPGRLLDAAVRARRRCASTSSSRGVRHAMVAMLPGEERTIGTIMLANRVRPRARVLGRGPAAARGAGQQRQRRAAVRPARAGRRPAARAAGAAAPPGLPRPAHRPARTARCSWSACARSCATRATTWPCCSSTSTTSRPSTTRSATASATRCWSAIAGRLRALRAPAGPRRAARRRRVRGDAARTSRTRSSSARMVADRILEAFERPSTRRRARLGAPERRHRLAAARSTATPTS